MFLCFRPTIDPAAVRIHRPAVLRPDHHLPVRFPAAVPHGDPLRFVGENGLIRHKGASLDPDFPVILVEVDEDGVVQAYKIYRLEELLVDSFGPDNLT